MWPPHIVQGDGEEAEEAAPQGKPVLSEQETRALQLLSGRAAVDVLVDALKQLPDSAAVCAKACEMMSNLLPATSGECTASHNELQRKAVQAGVLELLVGAMKRHIAHAAVVEHASEARAVLRCVGWPWAACVRPRTRRDFPLECSSPPAARSALPALSRLPSARIRRRMLPCVTRGNQFRPMTSRHDITLRASRRSCAALALRSTMAAPAPRGRWRCSPRRCSSTRAQTRWQ